MKSILYSLLQHLLKLDLLDALAFIWQAMRGIRRALRPLSREQLLITGRRNLSCEKCEMYDAHWKTCGTPGDVNPAVYFDDLRLPPLKVGCWCYAPLANRDPKKDCWARANNFDIGWTDDLRPKVHSETNSLS